MLKELETFNIILRVLASAKLKKKNQEDKN